MTEWTDEAWAERIHKELVGNILPFWMRHAVDRENGGFYGAIDENLHVETQAERSAVLNARILWTFSAASRLIGREYRETADWAYDTITKQIPGSGIRRAFLDARLSGQSGFDAQADLCPGLRHLRAGRIFPGDGQRPPAWITPRRLFASDRRARLRPGLQRLSGGARTRLAAARRTCGCSEKDLNSPKSMNTHLHILEAYTNLLRVWRDPALVAKQSELLDLTMERIVDAATRALQTVLRRGMEFAVGPRFIRPRHRRQLAASSRPPRCSAMRR